MHTILEDWTNKRRDLTTFSEDDLKGLMRQEKAGRCRETVLVAIHQRQSKLRTTRERDALTAYIAKKRAKRS